MHDYFKEIKPKGDLSFKERAAICREKIRKEEEEEILAKKAVAVKISIAEEF